VVVPTTPQSPNPPPRGVTHFRPVRALIDSYPVRALQHGLVLRLEPRRAAFTFTRFLRLPHQYDALAGPVLDHLRPDTLGRPLDIVAIGCSIGAQPYSAASTLLARRPDLRFTIRGFDIDPAVVARAEAGRFTEREVRAQPAATDAFIAATFDRDGDAYVVKPAIRAHLRFAVADALDPALPERVGPVDVLCCQNVLVNLPRRMAQRAFRNVVRLLRGRAVMLVDGMDLDLRARLTREAGLAPLDWQIREIHEEARALHGQAWPWHYWGIEPFSTRHRDWRWRYATVFLKGA
jgi:hypothetical protein